MTSAVPAIAVLLAGNPTALGGPVLAAAQTLRAELEDRVPIQALVRLPEDPTRVSGGRNAAEDRGRGTWPQPPAGRGGPCGPRGDGAATHPTCDPQVVLTCCSTPETAAAVSLRSVAPLDARLNRYSARG